MIMYKQWKFPQIIMVEPPEKTWKITGMSEMLNSTQIE